VIVFWGWRNCEIARDFNNCHLFQLKVGTPTSNVTVILAKSGIAK